MQKKALFLVFLIIGTTGILQAQPWLQPLLIRTSVDGTTFSSAQVFQDSSGVPSVIRLSNGTLICAFQWFPAPLMSAGWDSVAVKMSTDDGASWTSPTSVNISGLPGGYQRAFDPTLVETDSGQIRMYFSSGATGMGLDSMINTYSAISNDGINYTFESGTRFDVLNDPVIDPACTQFNGTWHYIAPVGAPQDGAHHATSTDGLNFIAQTIIPSDVSHNWTGNVVVDSNEMRFYGSGGTVWWNATTDGSTWSGYTTTNVTGGDPGIVRLADGTYIMIYVGFPGSAGIEDQQELSVQLYPNPATEKIFLSFSIHETYQIAISNLHGQIMWSDRLDESGSIDVSSLATGVYMVEIISEKTGNKCVKKMIKE